MIQEEYTQAAAQLGQLTFQVAVAEQQKAELMQKLSALAREAEALEKAKAPAALKSVPAADGT